MMPTDHDPAREPDDAISQIQARRRSRGQTAVDRERAAERRETAAGDRDRSEAEADQRNGKRGRAADNRDDAAAKRDAEASDRDRSDAGADQGTLNRGLAAEDRRHAASDREQLARDRGLSETDADQRASDRDQSARDREGAAGDRIATAADRAASDGDHEQAAAELKRAQVDQLTGAFGRVMGMIILEREITRARRGDGHLVLAYIDVDGLKQVNDRRGHVAGDGLLRATADAIQKHLRPYDTLVRVGGDEFLCAFVDCTLTIASSRVQDMRATMRDSQEPASISVGLAELRPEDNLETLVIRADNALYAQKRLP